LAATIQDLQVPSYEREPKEADYGLVGVFKDLYGNFWDLIELLQTDIDAISGSAAERPVFCLQLADTVEKLA
jgi:hypothetical protein